MIESLRQLGLNLWQWAPVVIPLAFLVYAGGWWAIWKCRPTWGRRWRVMLPAGGAVLFAVAGYVWWYYHRPLPPAVERELFPGVRYVREIRSEPRALVIHVVSVDLRTPGLEFFVTPGDRSKGREMIARTTSEFLREFDVDLAINAGFFTPWISHEPFYYYPKSGESVDVKGLAMSAGVEYSPAEDRYHPISISRSNRVEIGGLVEDAYSVVSGNQILLTNGQPVSAEQLGWKAKPLHPRTAVALDEAGETLLLIVIDGRQPNYSEGVSLIELAEIAREHGAHVMLNLDGGGSSALVMKSEDGLPDVLNSPIRGRIPPGMERPSANHLGLRVRLGGD